jgi:hypothetical protein
MNKSSTNCLEKNCLKKLLDANDIDELSQQKKENASAPNQRHTHKKPLREKKRKNKQAMLRQKDKQTSLNFIIYNL